MKDENHQNIVDKINHETQLKKRINHQKLIGTGICSLVVGLIIGIGGTSIMHNHSKNVITAEVNHHKYNLTSDEAFKYLIKGNNNQQILLGYTMNKILLKKYPNNNYQQKAQAKLNKVIAQVGGESNFEAELQQKNLNKEEYLISIENIMIIKDQLIKQYRPSENQIKNAYQQLGNRYNVSGIEITPQNANDKKSIIKAQQLAKKLNRKDFNPKAALKDKNNQVLVTGLSSDQGVKLNNINSNSNINLPSNLLSQLNNKKAGDVVISNTPYNHYLVKIDKVIPKGSLNKERNNIIKQLKQSAATDNNRQIAFSAQLLRDSNFKSNNADIQNMINSTKNK